MKQARPHSCNVLNLGEERQELWQFATGSQKLSLNAEHAGPVAGALPAKTIAKDWRTLIQPRLNVAWLPPEQVFLRVLHLPAADAAEAQAMIELQLEKVSPLPVNQIVWSFELLPRTPDNLQPAIVILVARPLVEEFLGKLEAKGYLADRLELPFLHELLATKISGDGVWLYPSAVGEKFHCFTAWWYGGVLRELILIHLPKTEQAGPVLREQLGNMAWSGELEGWLTAPPVLHLVAEDALAENFRSLAGLDAATNIVAPPAGRELAEASARHAAGEGARANLLPPEFVTRYRQQLVDRVWMRGLGAVVVAYVVLVALYLGWSQVIQWQRGGVEAKMAALSGSYTNAVQLKAKVQVLQEQLNLKYAALDAWKISAGLLPEDLRLTSFSISRGKSVMLYGDAGSDAVGKVTEYNRAMVGASSDTNGAAFFQKVNPPQQAIRADKVTWSFSADIKRSEVE
ncbi:MAG: hypothetical protein HY301_08870 [Verrucomicrobia bacterium]|nr:hypothetical protein [Verrucomicrobiota bacterium]